MRPQTNLQQRPQILLHAHTTTIKEVMDWKDRIGPVTLLRAKIKMAVPGRMSGLSQVVGNLTSAIKAIASPSCQSGNTNDTLYVDLWKEIEHKVLPSSLEHPWTSRSVTASILRNTLKAGYGQLWYMNMAFVRKMPYMRHLCVARSNACPLCSFEDSGSHILGGCRHKDMTKAYIERHNEAGRLIFKAIRNGTMGNNTFIADLGTKTHMQEMGALDTRLPPWLACESTI